MSHHYSTRKVNLSKNEAAKESEQNNSENEADEEFKNQIAILTQQQQQSIRVRNSK